MVSEVTFEQVIAVARALAEFGGAWCVAGGWAIDLFLQQPRRSHKDVDIAVFRPDQLDIQEYLIGNGWKLSKYVGNSVAVERMAGPKRLELPDRGLLAEPPRSDLPKIDILLGETDGARWWYHADPRITHPTETATMPSAVGVPILSPEIVLLFKARHVHSTDKESLLHRDADDLDFGAVLPVLGAQRRAWLAGALRLLYPNHPWLGQLTQSMRREDSAGA